MLANVWRIGGGWLVGVLLAAGVAAGMLGVGGCQRGTPGRAGGGGPMRVVVSIPPVAGLVRPLLPPDAAMVVLLAPGRSEHGYELTAGDVGAISRADLAVWVGLGLEPQIESYLRKHPVPGRREISLAGALGIADDEAHAEHDHAHDEHDDHDHHHGAIDPHLWLDPRLVLKLIPQLRAAIQADLESRGEYTSAEAARLDAAEQDLSARVGAVDEEYRTRLAPFAQGGGRAIVTHHAAWGRLAERYGLRVAAVIRPIEGSEPTPEAISAAVRAIREEHVGVIFVEPQFNPQAAQRIAQLAGVRVATLDPLGDGDWFKMMRANLDALVENLGRPAPLN